MNTQIVNMVDATIIIIFNARSNFIAMHGIKNQIMKLCHGRQEDQRRKVVHITSTAHLELPIQHTCNQVINDASPFQSTDETNFLSPTTSATANNGAITKLPSHDTS